jgi:hypothetical protein
VCDILLGPDITSFLDSLILTRERGRQTVTVCAPRSMRPRRAGALRRT